MKTVALKTGKTSKAKTIIGHGPEWVQIPAMSKEAFDSVKESVIEAHYKQSPEHQFRQWLEGMPKVDLLAAHPKAAVNLEFDTQDWMRVAALARANDTSIEYQLERLVEVALDKEFDGKTV